MSTALRLPAELAEFLTLPGPQTLLVRGAPGSGKSTLCLALLDAAQGERILVTNRVASPELHREFPWLGDNGSHGIRIVDTSAPDTFLSDSVRAAVRSAELVQDTPQARKDIGEFLLLPPPIQEAWSQIPPGSPALVVVDSWDALVEQYMGGLSSNGKHLPDRSEIERMLLRRMGQAQAHLVLVLERREESHLDYLVNGVVIAERDAFHDHLERWIRLPKLRGVRVPNASYPFTVEGAKFQCIQPIHRYSEIKPGPFDPEPDPIPEQLWPGSRDLADAFGRFPSGRVVLFEQDDEFPDAVVQLLLGPSMAFAMSRGGRVVLVPSPALSADEIWGSLSASIRGPKVAETLRILDVTGQLERTVRGERSELTPAVVSPKSLAPSTPGADPQDNEISRFLRGRVKDGPPSLAIVFLSGLKALASSMKIPLTPEMMDSFPASIQSTLGASSKLHFVAVGGSKAAFFEPLVPLSAVHVRLRMRQGRAFLYGAKPWTPGFVLTEAANGGPFSLLRIV
jgi:KaiC/GvpD/RAD55 family RecA-like ATPase